MARYIVERVSYWSVCYGINTDRENVLMYYTVWVGGFEINRCYLKTIEEAESLAEIWRNLGHDDVAIEEIQVG